MEPHVAVIGAGAAGMTAARELHRCGYRVTIYEASDRIGGRLYTEANPSDEDAAGMEMGAMRMPFFGEPGDKNCILEHYLLTEPGTGHAAEHALFPNPGSAPGNTGIYLNDGLGPKSAFSKPCLIDWKAGQDPDNKEIKNLSAKVTRYVTKFTEKVQEVYVKPSHDWERLWNNIRAYYQDKTFDEVVKLPVVNKFGDDGKFGGMGLDTSEAELLYTIGTGDGSWGAFYPVSALAACIQGNMVVVTTSSCVRRSIQLSAHSIWRGITWPFTLGRGT
ncbi:MAG: FAD-dependent oxidoreductase, partial [Pseudomonadota bacterium]